MHRNNWALIVPLANEEKEFDPFARELAAVLDEIGSGRVYLIIDRVSTDRTLELAQQLASRDKRFKAVWAPENRNVVDAYLRGYREAYDRGHDPIIEMDAGLSHDPRALPVFLEKLNAGNDCVFGSRFIKGGSIDGTMKRWILSKGGTIFSNFLLGTSLHDMTSGFQGFHRQVVGRFLRYKLLSKGHFYQTELRYLLRHTRYLEVPIHYKAPSPRVSQRSIVDSIRVLLYYFFRRITFKPAVL